MPKSLANLYIQWLRTETGPHSIPNYVWVLAFDVLALAEAALLGFPVFAALLHGVPLSGTFTLPAWMVSDRGLRPPSAGQSSPPPIMPFAAIDAVVIVCSIIALISGAYFGSA